MPTAPACSERPAPALPSRLKQPPRALADSTCASSASPAPKSRSRMNSDFSASCSAARHAPTAASGAIHSAPICARWTSPASEGILPRCSSIHAPSAASSASASRGTSDVEQPRATSRAASSTATPRPSSVIRKWPRLTCVDASASIGSCCATMMCRGGRLAAAGAPASANSKGRAAPLPAPGALSRFSIPLSVGCVLSLLRLSASCCRYRSGSACSIAPTTSMRLIESMPRSDSRLWSRPTMSRG